MLSFKSISFPNCFNAALLPFSAVYLPILALCSSAKVAGLFKISLAGAYNSVTTTGLTPCIIIVHAYTCIYSGAEKNIDARWHFLAPRMAL